MPAESFGLLFSRYPVQVPSAKRLMLVRPVALMLTWRAWPALGEARQIAMLAGLAPTPVAWKVTALAPPVSRNW